MDLIVLDPTENPSEDAMLTTPIRKHLSEHRPACFHKEVDADGICWLTFDTPDSPANVWNPKTLDEFDCHIEDLHRDSGIKAVILRSAKDRVFIAGADLKAVQTLPDEERRNLLALGQDVFTHLEALRIPKIALIHGACVGGGLETVLACDWRIASDSDVTRLGLPEVMLGLIPGWGGCTRLSRLIGLPKALDLIVRGKLVKASHAKKLGIVQHVVPRERMEDLARKMALSANHRPRRHHLHLTQAWPVPQILRFRVKTMLWSKFPWMRHHDAAPIAAVDVITRGAGRTAEKSLALEQETLRRLTESGGARRFIDVFLRKEAASKKLPQLFQGIEAPPITRAAVIGAGVMGSGIAYTLASRGTRVLLKDMSNAALAKGAGRIGGLLHSGVKSRALTTKQGRETHDLISFTSEEVPLKQMDLVIEAVVEDMEVKKHLFAELAAQCRPDTILATNTSALSVEELAAATPHPERVIGLHFFNPAHLMPLVEVITPAQASPAAIAAALRFVQGLGKTPIVVKDRPGFVVNRILMPYLLGAVQIASTMRDPWELDDAMTDFGMPMGPLRLLDEVGFDVALHVEKTLRAAFGDRIPQSDLLDQLATAGMMGHKNGRGFYTGFNDRHGPQPNPEILRYIKPRELPEFTEREQMATYLNGLMQKEGQLCLEEGVAASASDIELAMILGSGYPAFRSLFPPATSPPSDLP
ncbi:FAD-dependent oxidoreductase [Verrucomicrobium sp. BvORR034]|uniref:FAD-dependent oxidoreductase n=1 Tax=Verrucomicrobium sp. BvORR034 TaxID=1396418 RepID=UPI000679B22D|nr:FAD-dependent oxidoreductase [Verrucomicrobium sp. BvORR034]